MIRPSRSFCSAVSPPTITGWMSREISRSPRRSRTGCQARNAARITSCKGNHHMTTFRQLLDQVRAGIREVDVDGARTLIDEHRAAVVDVREADEVEQGIVPGAIPIPRGYLELRVEDAVPDKSAPVVVYCAGGTRSVFAAKTLADLGYTNVVSLAGGFNAWKDTGQPWSQPRTLTPDQKRRYSRHLLIPEIGERG